MGPYKWSYSTYLAITGRGPSCIEAMPKEVTTPGMYHLKPQMKHDKHVLWLVSLPPLTYHPQKYGFNNAFRRERESNGLTRR